MNSYQKIWQKTWPDHKKYIKEMYYDTWICDLELQIDQNYEICHFCPSLKNSIIGHDLDKRSRVNVKFWPLVIYPQTCQKHRKYTKQVYNDKVLYHFDQRTGQNQEICNFQNLTFIMYNKIILDIIFSIILVNSVKKIYTYILQN